MLIRAAVISSAVLLGAAGIPALGVEAQPALKLDRLLDGKGPATLTIEAPLAHLFEIGSEDENVTVPGTVTFKHPDSGEDVVLPDVEVSVRGHTSRRETECTFPKLKLKLKGAGSLKVGTHCGESADEELSPRYGRLANEKSPLREALVYDLLRTVDAPVLRTRAARISYIDKAQAAPLERHALLLEDDDDAMKLVGCTA
jgi:hypothetical protein